MSLPRAGDGDRADRPATGRLDALFSRDAFAPSAGDIGVDRQTKAVAVVRHYLQQRRARDAIFPGNLFGEPAWDILLDLYVAEVEQRRVAVSSACIAAAVPHSTAMRWIEKLISVGLIVKTDDIDDRRRSFVRLADGAADRIASWVARTWPIA